MSEQAVAEVGAGKRRIKNPHTGGKKGAVHLPEQLRAYRHVARHEEDKDRTGLQKVLRRQYKENPGRFLSEMTKLESSWMANKPRREEEALPVVVEDEGTERVLEHLGRVLGEWKDGATERAGGLSEGARQPNAGESGRGGASDAV